MSFSHSIALLLALLPLDVRDLLREPDYQVIGDGDTWVVQKPEAEVRKPIAISRHRARRAAEFRNRSLPRLRLDGRFVRFDPATYARTPLADWTGQEDARRIEADIREILNRFAPAGAQMLLESVPIYMARLAGASGYTAEENTDHRRLVIYVDPF